MRSIGGTIRLGELSAGCVIHHALKCSIPGSKSLYYDAESKGYRWPAVKADGYAAQVYGGKHQYCRMGSLLALKPSFDLKQLNTVPGKIIARACRDYGIYVVDDCHSWDTFQIATEWSPDGRVVDEFKKVWGYPFSLHRQPGHPWWQDIETIFTNLHVIVNNGPQSIGGGGTPRERLAPPISPNLAPEN